MFPRVIGLKGACRICIAMLVGGRNNASEQSVEGMDTPFPQNSPGVPCMPLLDAGRATLWPPCKIQGRIQCTAGPQDATPGHADIGVPVLELRTVPVDPNWNELGLP
eukprot:12644718-Alexandrium_andersonii.AAC.1